MKNPLSALHTRFICVDHEEIREGKQRTILVVGLLLIPEFHLIEIAAEVPHPASTDDCQNRGNQKHQVGAIRLWIESRNP